MYNMCVYVYAYFVSLGIHANDTKSRKMNLLINPIRLVSEIISLFLKKKKKYFYPYRISRIFGRKAKEVFLFLVPVPVCHPRERRESAAR